MLTSNECYPCSTLRLHCRAGLNKLQTVLRSAIVEQIQRGMGLFYMISLVRWYAHWMHIHLSGMHMPLYVLDSREYSPPMAGAAQVERCGAAASGAKPMGSGNTNIADLPLRGQLGPFLLNCGACLNLLQRHNRQAVEGQVDEG